MATTLNLLHRARRILLSNAASSYLAAFHATPRIIREILLYQSAAATAEVMDCLYLSAFLTTEIQISARGKCLGAAHSPFVTAVVRRELSPSRIDPPPVRKRAFLGERNFVRGSTLSRRIPLGGSASEYVLLNPMRLLSLSLPLSLSIDLNNATAHYLIPVRINGTECCPRVRVLAEEPACEKGCSRFPLTTRPPRD